MNRILIIAGLFLTSFLLIGCDSLNETTGGVVLLPSIEILGEGLIIVEQYTDFVDPGAQIIGDFNLDITVVGDVDTDTIGTYIITYSIVYLETTYSIDRTVNVVDSIEFNLDINLSDITITNTEVSFTVSLDDPNGDLIDPVVVLYQGTTVLRTYPISNGDTAITIDTFSANTNYRIAIEGSYLVGSVVTYLEGYEVSFTSLNVDAVADIPTIEIVNTEATTDTISFNINITDIDLVGELTNIKLYQGETLLNGNLDLTMRNLTDLTSDTEYTIKATYTYDLYDGEGEQTLEATLTVSTLIEIVPITFTNSNEVFIYDDWGGKYSSTINVVDLYESLSEAIVKLYKGDFVVSYSDLVVGDNFFDQWSLNPETEYILKVEYTYTPQGSSTPVSESITLSTFTITVPKPTVESATINDFSAYGFDYRYTMDESGFSGVGVYLVVYTLEGTRLGEFHEIQTNPGFIEVNIILSEGNYVLKLFADYNEISTGITYSDVIVHQKPLNLVVIDGALFQD